MIFECTDKQGGGGGGRRADKISKFVRNSQTDYKLILSK